MVNEDMQLHYSCIHAISLLLLKQMSGQNYNDFCQAVLWFKVFFQKQQRNRKLQDELHMYCKDKFN